jgi:hypothetical protein
MRGAGLFVPSPALLQSAALSTTARGHPNPGLARSSRRPGLTPAGLWPTMTWWRGRCFDCCKGHRPAGPPESKHRPWKFNASPNASLNASAAPKVRRTQPRARWRSHRRPGFHANTTVSKSVARQRCAGECVSRERRPRTAQTHSSPLPRSFRARPWEGRGVIVLTQGLLVPRGTLG